MEKRLDAVIRRDGSGKGKKYSVYKVDVPVELAEASVGDGVKTRGRFRDLFFLKWCHSAHKKGRMASFEK